MTNDLNFNVWSIIVWQSAKYYLWITMHTAVPYNMATTDITLDGAEFSDLTAPYKG